MKKALFITFEGIDGCGKTTAAERLCSYLKGKGQEAVLTFEPGGCEWGQNMRDLLLHGTYAPAPETEALLFAADRAEHMQKTILPTLKQGKFIVCDRFSDSTLAYQGGGRGMDMQALAYLSDFASLGRRPDITFYLAVPLEIAMQRRGVSTDRMENEENAFFQKVADTYEMLAEQHKERIKRIDASGDIESVWRQIKEETDKYL